MNRKVSPPSMPLSITESIFSIPATFYGVGHNELLVGRAIQGRRDRVYLSVKFGAMRSPDGSWVGFDARPAAVKNFLSYSLTRLAVDYIDIYRPARLDPQVPIEDTMGALAELVKAGYIRYIGLSEVGPETIRRAQAVHPVLDLQIEYSLISRSPETKVFPVLQELGIAVTAYGVLSRGLFSGAKPTANNDFRARLPRFSGDNLTQNMQVVEKLRSLANEKGLTPSELAIAWVLAKSNNIVPVIGARKRTQLEESLGALSVELTSADLSRIEQTIPPDAVAGDRYDQHAMQMLDSER
jgi:aryl-alcohol dehydrogenase-like predicted oxidoreductase